MAGSGTEANPVVDNEIDDLKQKYGKICSVIRNIGDYKFMLSVKVHVNVTVKFQLSENYPEVGPEIIIRSELHQSDRDSLLGLLKKKACENRGSSMLDGLITEAFDFVENHENIPDFPIASDDDKQGRKQTKYKDKKKRNKKSTKDDTTAEKKPPMKTATDVISRILWDENLPTDEFTVGYIDRFVGLVEKPFSAFSWEDIASVDYTVLAIPKHRIEYFKYKNLKVWDKNSRMDNVFGSTGSGKTIAGVIEKYEQQLAEKMCLTEQSTDLDLGNVSVDDDSDDDDDDITINIGTNSVYPGQHEEYIDEELDANGEESQYNPYWPDKLRPNHFIAIRITNEEVCQTVQHIQDVITEKEDRYGPCCVPEPALHVTLCTLGLDTSEQLSNAIKCLKDNEDELVKIAQKKIKLTIDGVSNFYNRVLYARVQHGNDLTELYEYLKLILRSAGLDIRDNHDFVPHVTIMKVTRPVGKALGNRISPFVYEGCETTYLGEQIVDGIHLCSMSNERRSDGFYLTPASVEFKLP
ncbi:uncharacterized protein LOC141902640 [Tubulanus polymorphus]|uniref:uncharacterized protein LOC141902640 n=1 Tax=Tubulanus polymorphus TaxID=672921 RepID=UPI003DA33427